jgi:hypothetical protein
VPALSSLEAAYWVRQSHHDSRALKNLYLKVSGIWDFAQSKLSEALSNLLLVVTNIKFITLHVTDGVYRGSGTRRLFLCVLAFFKPATSRGVE